MFSDKTQSSGTVELSLYASTSDDDGKIILMVRSIADHWQFLEGADVHVLADGRRIDLGHFRAAGGHVETDIGVSTIEDVASYVERSALGQMASAKDLEIEVGLYACRVNSKNIQRLKEFTMAIPAAMATK